MSSAYDYRDEEEKKKNIITTALIGILINIIVYILIFLCLESFITNDYKYYLASNVIANIISSLMLQISRGLGNNKIYAVGSFLNSIMYLVLNILFVVIFKLGAQGMLISNLISNIICAIYVFFFLRLFNYFNIRNYELLLLRKLYKYSVPLVPNSISWWVFNASDRAIISWVLGLAANGIYSAANKFSGMYISLYNIFSISWIESASVHIDDHDSGEFFSNTIDAVFRFFTSFCLIIICALPFTFKLLIDYKFSEAYYQIPILMLSSLCNVVVGLYSAIYIAKKLTVEVAKTSIVAAIINFVLNIVLINSIGLYAASISTAVAYGLLMIYRYIDAKKYVNIRFDMKIVLSSIIMMILVLYSYYSNNIIIQISITLITIIYSMLINRKIINIVFSILKTSKRIT